MEFADRLVPATIQNALRHPFYQRFWQGIDTERIVTAADLVRLPVLEKPAARELLEVPLDRPPALVTHSSGTTGELTLRCRSAEEILAYQRVIAGDEDGLPAGGERPLTLSVDSANHGGTIGLPRPGLGLRAVGFDMDVIDQVIQQLLRTYQFPGYTPRVQAISASLGFLKALTAEILHRGIHPADLGVRILVTFGDYVTRLWSERLESFWGASLIDRYSCAEVIGGARRCRRCGWFSFDPVSALEVVDLRTGRPIEEGIGRILLTELYPFSQLQPLIRFAVGDVVEVSPRACDGSPGPIFRVLGRVERCVIDPSGTLLLAGVDLEEVLDGRTDLRREGTFQCMPVNEGSFDLAPPFARTELVEDRELRLEVVPKFVASLFPDQARQLCDEIRAALLERSPALRRRVEGGSLSICVRTLLDPFNLEGFTGT